MYINILGNFDALFITNPTNIRYLTGFVGVAENEREAHLLLLKNDAFLFTSGIYAEQAQKQLLHCYIATLLKKPVQLIKLTNEQTIGKRVKDVLDLQSRNRSLRIGFEENDLKVAEYNRILKRVQDDNRKIDVIATKNRIEKLRMIKQEDKIENIREAARLTDECFEYIVRKFKPASRRGGSASRGGPSLTESEIAWEIESFIRKNGAELSFSPIVAFGAHSSQPHYQPSILYSSREESSTNREVHIDSSRLHSNDIILLDFGARVNGYCADMTRVIFVVKPKPEWIRAYETVLRAQESAINYLRAQGPALGSQLSGKKADQIARTIIKEAGYPVYPHSLGHGVGLAIHEAPRLTIKRDTTLKPGMVVTIEPGIYIEGQYGIRIEDLLLIKENDIEILSLSPKSLIIL